MAWRIEWSDGALDELDRLDHEPRRRIVRFMRERIAGQDPRQLGHALHGKRRLWRYRVGDYRVVCDLQDDVLVVLVVRIAHRSSIYR